MILTIQSRIFKQMKENKKPLSMPVKFKTYEYYSDEKPEQKSRYD